MATFHLHFIINHLLFSFFLQFAFYYYDCDQTAAKRFFRYCFENWGTLVAFDRIGGISNFVVGDVCLAPIGTLNAVGVWNDGGKSVDVFFCCIVLTLDSIFGGQIRIDPPNEQTLAIKYQIKQRGQLSLPTT